MLFRQFVDGDLGCASYLIADETTACAVVVDPAYAVEPYLDEVDRRGLRIERVLETHTHADHVSGHGRLALEYGIPVSIHPAAEPEFPFDPLADGQEIDLGEVAVRVLHTPGHRPEHCCFAVLDRSRADEPWLVVSGDSLLVGDAARPDLAVAAEEGARGLYRSLRRLLELPDGVEVYPGHVAGSLCGAAVSSKASTTIGFERRFNRALALDGEEAFVAETATFSAPRPPNMERIVALNRGPFLGAQPPPEAVDEVGNAAVLDVRPAAAFAAGHVPGALNVPVSGSSFATKAAFVLPRGRRVVLHADSTDEAERAGRGLNAVGILEVDGYLADPDARERLATVELEELDRLLEQDAVQVLDVREPSERADGYIPGSRNVPYRIVPAFADDMEDGKPVVTICSSGSRAAVAASVLAARGIDARPVLDAGVQDWVERGGSAVSFRRCGS